MATACALSTCDCLPETDYQARGRFSGNEHHDLNLIREQSTEPLSLRQARLELLDSLWLIDETLGVSKSVT